MRSTGWTKYAVRTSAGSRPWPSGTRVRWHPEFNATWESPTTTLCSAYGHPYSGQFLLAGAGLHECGELLPAAVEDGDAWGGTGVMSRPDRWTAALNQHLSARSTLVKRIRSGIGISQGSRGAVGMIDAARAIPLLEEATATWAWETPTGSIPRVGEARS